MHKPASAAGLWACSLFSLLLLSACDSDDPIIFLDGKAADELSAVADAAADDPTIRNLMIQVDSPRQGFQWRTARGSVNGPGSTPMTVDSVFRVGDVTKMLTSVVVLKLVENNFFDLDTPIGDILDDTDMPGAFTLAELHERNGELRGGEITVGQLLAHTSGLRDYMFNRPDNGAASLSLAQRIVADVLGEIPSGISERHWFHGSLLEYFFESGMSANALAAPGAEYRYSGTNYLLLGVIVQKVSQLTLAQMYRNAIYGEAQMNNTYLEWNEDPKGEPVDHFWAVARNNEVVNIDINAEGVNTSSIWGGGGIVANAADLSSFIRELFDGSFFAEESSLTSMRTTGSTGEPGYFYGLGLEHRIFNASGRTIDVYGHSGFWGTGVYYIPATGTSIVYTMNQVELGEDWLLEILRALNEAQLFTAVR